MHHTTVHELTVSFRAEPHKQGACVFSCNLPPALLAEYPGSFPCYCGNTGWNGYRSKSHHMKLTIGKKTILPLLPGLEPETFRSPVRRCTTEPSPLPQFSTLQFKIVRKIPVCVAYRLSGSTQKDSWLKSLKHFSQSERLNACSE